MWAQAGEDHFEWLLTRAGALFALARAPQDCVRVFSAARKRSYSGSLVYIERAWGDASLKQNDLDQAIEHYRLALDAARTMGASLTAGRILQRIGTVHIARRQAAQALLYLKEALSAFGERHHPVEWKPLPS